MLTANQAVARYLEGARHRLAAPRPRKTRSQENSGIRGAGADVRLFAGRRKSCRAPRGRETRKHAPGSDSTAARGTAARGGGREKPMTVSLPGVLDIAIRPEHYQRLAEKIAGKPEERIVSYLMLRSLKQARYSADALGHFALAFDQYTHFTSPIRRYPDLIVHRVLKWALDHPESKPARREAACAAQATGTRKTNPRSARIAAANSKPSPRKLPRPSAAPKPPSAN